MLRNFPFLNLCILSATILSSCSSYEQISRTYDIKKAHVSIDEKSPKHFSRDKYYRFTISSQTSKDLVFPIRCAMEEAGFKYVAYGEEPDLMVSVEAALPYRLTYLPPQETVYQTKNFEGLVVEKYLSSPAYAERFFQPKMTIRLFDHQSKQLIWKASGSGEVAENLKTLSHQLLLRQVLALAPKDPDFEKKKAELDLDFIVISDDKKSFYPRVLSVNNDKLRKQLQNNDTLKQLNEQSLANLSSREVMTLLNEQGKQAQVARLSFMRKERLMAAEYTPQKSPLMLQKPTTEYLAQKIESHVMQGKNLDSLPKDSKITQSTSIVPLKLTPFTEELLTQVESTPKDPVLRPEFLNNLEKASHYLERFNEQDFSFIDDESSEDSFL